MLKVTGNCNIDEIPFLQAYLIKEHGMVATLEELVVFWEIFSRRQYNQNFIKIQSKNYEGFASWLSENVTMREIEGEDFIDKWWHENCADKED